MFIKVDDIVGEHTTYFKEHYYIKKSGNCDLSSMSDPHDEFKGKNVLIERNSSDAMASKFGLPLENYHEILGVSRKKLFDARSKRPRPHLDDKVEYLVTRSYLFLVHEGGKMSGLCSGSKWYSIKRVLSFL